MPAEPAAEVAAARRKGSGAAGARVSPEGESIGEGVPVGGNALLGNAVSGAARWRGSAGTLYPKVY